MSSSESVSREEQLFLESYSIDSYDRPSVTADIAAFAVHSREDDCYRKNPVHTLSVLLIKRGEHPFKEHWALPGGFLRQDETIEECALREINEETGFIPVSLMPVATFSEPGRDPRGRIISHAYTSVISEKQARIIGSGDAVDAKWFEVSFDESSKGIFNLTLRCDDIVLTAQLKEQKNKFGRVFFKIIENDGLAFDHAVIIASALAALRYEAANIETVFDFMPEKFTLAALQQVQETLMGTTFLTANYRRKIADCVEETDEYTEGAGHRPARLFKRKLK